nr:hypothetical protein [Tanacetum cinerariifolium]
MDSIFNISNCTVVCQVKYVACTLQGVALTWWNSYVKIVTLEVAQALPWKTLKKMMTEKIEKYIGGLPDTIHDSIKASKPKTMQEAIKFAFELMDKRIHDAVENKRKFDGSKPLCSKYDYNYEDPCPPRCNNCKRVSHLTRDCRSRLANANNNNNTNNNNRNNNNNNHKGNGQKQQCSSKGVCGLKCMGKPRQRCFRNAVDRTNPRAVRDRVDQSCVKKFFDFFLDDVMNLWVDPSLIEKSSSRRILCEQNSGSIPLMSVNFQ